MKKLFLVFAALLAITAGSTIWAVTPEASSNCDDCFVYTFVTGDTMWGLTGPQWRELLKYDYNSWLNSRITEKSPDDVFVLVKSGEKILVPKGFGIEETLGLNPPTPANPPISPVLGPENNDPSKAKTAAPTSFQWWMWIPFLLVLLMGAIVATGIIFGLLHRNPATAGPAIIPGGIPPGDTRAIEDHFTTVAWRRYLQIDPGADRSTTRIERVGPIEEGFLSGWGFVCFDNFRRLFMYLKRELAYRARFRFPNGTEEELFFIQRCANDAYRGTRYRGFRFEPRVHGASIPTPTPPTEEPARRQATALHLVDRENPDVEPTRIKVVGAEIDIPSGGIIDIDSRGNCVVTVCGVTFAVKARRPAQTRSMKPAAAATSDGGTQ